MGVLYRFVALGLVALFAGAACSSSKPTPEVPQHVITQGQPDNVYFRPVLCMIPPESHNAAPSGPATACLSRTPALIANSDQQETAASPAILSHIGGGVRYVCGPADLTSADIVSARAESSPGVGFGYEVVIKLTPAGARKLDRIAAARYAYYKQNPANPPVQSREAIEQGQAVLVAPPIEAPSFRGSIVINPPGMSLNFADEIAGMINQIVAYNRAHASQA